jgi:hypothetical protein
MKGFTKVGASLGALLVSVSTAFAIAFAAPADAHYHRYWGGGYGYHHWHHYAAYGGPGPCGFYGVNPYAYGPAYYGRPRLSLRQSLYGLGL